MYKVQIDISNWVDDESIAIETSDFNKVQIIQEFIEFQQTNGWINNYDLITADAEEVKDEPSMAPTCDAAKTEA